MIQLLPLILYESAKCRVFRGAHLETFVKIEPFSLCAPYSIHTAPVQRANLGNRRRESSFNSTSIKTSHSFIRFYYPLTIQ